MKESVFFAGILPELGFKDKCGDEQVEALVVDA
jgi:hypothetical protein